MMRFGVSACFRRIVLVRGFAFWYSFHEISLKVLRFTFSPSSTRWRPVSSYLIFLNYCMLVVFTSIIILFLYNASQQPSISLQSPNSHKETITDYVKNEKVSCHFHRHANNMTFHFLRLQPSIPRVVKPGFRENASIQLHFTCQGCLFTQISQETQSQPKIHPPPQSWSENQTLSFLSYF